MPAANLKTAVLTVVSSFARDTLVDPKLKVIKIQRGGPAFFISQALENEKVNYRLVTGEIIDVEVLVDSANEYGKVFKKYPVQHVPRINSQFTLLSTLLREWPINNASYKNTSLFIDIQGFTRSRGNFGKKRTLAVPHNFVPFCIKGTSEEISCLPKSFIQRQKQRLVIETRGSRGSIIFWHQRRTVIIPSHRITSPDTIGAGDSFFAYFIAQYIQSGNPILSARYATKKTEGFLRRKL